MKSCFRVMLTVLCAAALVGSAAIAQIGQGGIVKRHKLRASPEARAAAAHPANGVLLSAPLPGLDASQLATFNGGLEEFQSVETPEGGLGPIFNDSACAACHTAGGIGGASDQTVTRFGRLVNGVFDPLAQLGGSLLQAQAIDPKVQEQIPAQANVIAKRVTTPLFGAGLIEAIADGDIEANAARRKPDGIAGRVAYITDIVSGTRRVGRFGWKAQHATILAFASDAYLNEMGITNRFFPNENAPNGRADLLAAFDKVADIEDSLDPATGKSDIDHSADFIRFLAAPATGRLTANSMAGGKLFEHVQCAACHTPVLMTGASSVNALAHKPVPLYSDLLLHDMGALGDGISQEAANGREMRTAPLWGLRARPALLHDGRAKTVQQAIEQHDGEALTSRKLYSGLSPNEKRQLLEFLSGI